MRSSATPIVIAIIVALATACSSSTEQARDDAQGQASQRAADFQQSLAAALSGVEPAARDARTLQMLVRHKTKHETVVRHTSTPTSADVLIAFTSGGTAGGGLTYGGATVVACFDTIATWEAVTQTAVTCPPDGTDIPDGVQFAPVASGTAVANVGNPTCYGEDCPGG